MTSASPQRVPLFLFWHSTLKDNYTTASGDGIHEARQLGYRQVRIEGYVYDRTATGTVPLKLYRHPTTRDSFLVASKRSEVSAERFGYEFVRIEGHVFADEAENTVRLNQFWFPHTQTDFFATATAQGQQDARAAGYMSHGTEGWIYPANEGPPITEINIIGKSFVLDVGDTVEFTTDHPDCPTLWTCSNTSVLQRRGNGNRFVAETLEPGEVTIEAWIYGCTTLAFVAVREGKDEIIQRPVSVFDLEFDAWTKCNVIRNQLVVVFRKSTSDGERQKLMEDYGLCLVGLIPSLYVYQTVFRPDQWDLETLVRRLNEERNIDVAMPDFVATASNDRADRNILPEDPPTEVRASEDKTKYWHLHKLEAFAAFALRDSIADATKKSIIFIDRGINVDADGRAHPDIHDCVDFRLSADLSRSKPRYAEYMENGVLVRNHQVLNPDGDTSHGVHAASAALAKRNSRHKPVGITFDSSAIMIKHNLGNWFSAIYELQHVYEMIKLEQASKRETMRVITLGAIIDGNNFCNWLSHGVGAIQLGITLCKKLREVDALVVIPAGNNGVSTKYNWPSNYFIPQHLASNFITVGGTTLKDLAQPYHAEQRLNLPGTESCWDPDWRPGDKQGNIELAAPADCMWLCHSYDGVTSGYSGTSLAAPLVAAAAAMLFAILPKKTKAETVKRILVESSDPIVVSGAPPCRPRIETEPNKGIGIGRLNVWQALLNALNNEGKRGNKRYVGVRVVMDRELDETWDFNRGKLPPKIPDDWADTTALRFTSEISLDGQEQSIPLVLKQGDYVPRYLYKRHIKVDEEFINRLHPHYTIDVCLYTEGGIKVETLLSEPHYYDGSTRLKEVYWKLRFENTGKQPIAHLDPKKSGVGKNDPSLLPHMKLESGDTYAWKIDCSPLGGSLPPGDVELLDETRTTPASPLITIPFADDEAKHSRLVWARWKDNFPIPPPGHDGKTAKFGVVVGVWSIHNECVRDGVVLPTEWPER